MLKLDIITLFPQLIKPHLEELPFKKALEKNLIEINFHQLRDHAIDKHGTVDDKPYGGGTGMVLRVEPIYEALCKVFDGQKKEDSKIVVLTPQGVTYNQDKAENFSESRHIVLICGRYEGIDNRVFQLDEFIGVKVEPLSIGNFILSGGELAALVVLESTVRLIPGVLEKEEASRIESFSHEMLFEYPHYTRPENFKGLKVPDVLLSGNHKDIEEWRRANSQKD